MLILGRRRKVSKGKEENGTIKMMTKRPAIRAYTAFDLQEATYDFSSLTKNEARRTRIEDWHYAINSEENPYFTRGISTFDNKRLLTILEHPELTRTTTVVQKPAYHSLIYIKGDEGIRIDDYDPRMRWLGVFFNKTITKLDKKKKKESDKEENNFDLAKKFFEGLRSK